MIGEPRLLILDEPSAGLAPMVIDRILTVASELCKGGIAILLVEQMVEKALRHAGYCYLVETGRVAAAGTPKEIQASDVLHQTYLGGHAAAETLEPWDEVGGLRGVGSPHCRRRARNYACHHGRILPKRPSAHTAKANKRILPSSGNHGHFPDRAGFSALFPRLASRDLPPRPCHVLEGGARVREQSEF